MNKKELIENLARRGFSQKILAGFEKVNREDFISEKLQKYAYADRPLPIGKAQTISQPYTIAFMLDLLELKDRQKILEAGSGSGYVLALMSEISKDSEIYGIERIKELADRSEKVLKNKKNIFVKHGDGARGLKEKSSFDRILVSASADEIPQELLAQLKIKGIMVVPVRGSILQIKKQKTKNKIKEFPGFVFVRFVE